MVGAVFVSPSRQAALKLTRTVKRLSAIVEGTMESCGPDERDACRRPSISGGGSPYWHSKTSGTTWTTRHDVQPPTCMGEDGHSCPCTGTHDRGLGIRPMTAEPRLTLIGVHGCVTRMD